MRSPVCHEYVMSMSRVMFYFFVTERIVIVYGYEVIERSDSVIAVVRMILKVCKKLSYLFYKLIEL